MADYTVNTPKAYHQTARWRLGIQLLFRHRFRAGAGCGFADLVVAHRHHGPLAAPWAVGAARWQMPARSRRSSTAAKALPNTKFLRVCARG